MTVTKLRPRHPRKSRFRATRHGVFRLILAGCTLGITFVVLAAFYGPSNRLVNVLLAYAAVFLLVWLTRPTREYYIAKGRHSDLSLDEARKQAHADLRADLQHERSGFHRHMFTALLIDLFWPVSLWLEARLDTWR